MDSDILNQNFGTLLQNNEFRTALEEEKIIEPSFADLDLDKIDFNEIKSFINVGPQKNYKELIDKMKVKVRSEK